MYTNVNTPQKLTTWNRVCDNIDLIKVPSANNEEVEYKIQIYIDKDGKLYYYDIKGNKLYIEPKESNPPTTDKDINSELNVGGITPGDVIPGGSTITDIVDLIVGTKDWTGTYPKVYVFVQDFDSANSTDDNYYYNADLYMCKDESLGTIKILYNLMVRDGCFSLDNQTVKIPNFMSVSNNSNNWYVEIDMSLSGIVEISGLYLYEGIKAKDLECLNSKGEPSKSVLAAKALDYIKRIHICDALYYLVAAQNDTSSTYNRHIIYDDKETSYSFTVNPGGSLSLHIPQGYLYSITDQNGVNIFSGMNGTRYLIGVATTGVKSTFTITLNPILEEDDN